MNRRNLVFSLIVVASLSLTGTTSAEQYNYHFEGNWQWVPTFPIPLDLGCSPAYDRFEGCYSVSSAAEDWSSEPNEGRYWIDSFRLTTGTCNFAISSITPGIPLVVNRDNYMNEGYVDGHGFIADGFSDYVGPKYEWLFSGVIGKRGDEPDSLPDLLQSTALSAQPPELPPLIDSNDCDYEDAEKYGTDVIFAAFSESGNSGTAYSGCLDTYTTMTEPCFSNEDIDRLVQDFYVLFEISSPAITPKVQKSLEKLVLKALDAYYDTKKDKDTVTVKRLTAFAELVYQEAGVGIPWDQANQLFPAVLRIINLLSP